MNKYGLLYLELRFQCFHSQQKAEHLVFVQKNTSYPIVNFTGFKITKSCLFNNNRNTIDRSVSIIQIQPLTLRGRGSDQFMYSEESRVTTETDSSKQNSNLAFHGRKSDRISGFYS